MTESIDHFPLREFACKAYVDKDGYHQPVAYPKEWVEGRLEPLKRLLEKIRLACGSRPVEIRCGYRTVEYNAHLRDQGLKGERHATGVALNSHHTSGRAADISVFGLETIVVLQTVLSEFSKGHLEELGGVGYYPTLGFVHVDTVKDPSGRLRRWNG